MNPNDLLIWLSAKGYGSWARYRAAVDEMQVSVTEIGDDEDLREDVTDNSSLPIHHRLRLNLERLGHAEFFRKDLQNGWRVVPPILACRSNQKGAVGIVCGARTDQLMAHIKDAGTDLQITVTEQPECPARIQLTGTEQQHLKDVADSAGLYFQPDAVRMLLAAVPPIDDWQLRTPAELPFGSDWEVSIFSANKLGWTSVSADDARSTYFGLFRFQMAYQPQYFLCLNGKGYKIPVQVGKYIVLRKQRRRVVSYDYNNRIFSVPVSCRPPLLIDRALTLCSGLIPSVESGCLMYRNINKAVALTASSLLKV